MPYYVTKTGLDAFDTARAWGLAVVIYVLTGNQVEITDADLAYIVKPLSPVPTRPLFSGNTKWPPLFEEQSWQRVFMTAKSGWQKKRDQARQILENNVSSLFLNLADPGNFVNIGTGESLPGSLDPTSFKSLRHTTKARYGEGQLEVEKGHWALACLGMTTCGIFRYSKEASQSNWLVLLPVPQQIRFSYFRDVQDLFRLTGLRYHGIQNAAAHYSVQLAKRLRQRAAAQGSLRDRFSAVLYFRLFGAGQQIKPAQGNQLRLDPLMDAITRDPHRSQTMLEWLDYCFRLGSTEGAEDLALAATELVMRWDLDAYYGLIRVLTRHLAQNRIKSENLPSIQSLKEVMTYVSI